MSKVLVAMQRGIIWAAFVIPEPNAPTRNHIEFYKDAVAMRRAAEKIPDSEVKELDTEQVRQMQWGKPTHNRQGTMKQRELPGLKA